MMALGTTTLRRPVGNLSLPQVTSSPSDTDGAVRAMRARGCTRKATQSSQRPQQPYSRMFRLEA